MSVNEGRDQERGNDTTSPFETTWAWKGGGLAGFLATIVMGAFITAMNLPTLQLAIAGLYGQSGDLAAGWFAHLAHGTLFGMLFALVLSDPGLYKVTDWHWKTVVAGAVYGLMLAIAGAGIIMPIWLGFAGFPTPLSIPNVTVPMLIWHLIYGLVLGGIFPVVEEI